MKIALVYDRVNKIGGAERVLETLHEIWPQAPLYTAVYNPETAPWAKKFQVIPSFLNKWPLAKKYHEAYPWLTPLAFESFDFSSFDVVISVTSADAKGIITKPSTFHLCYCLTPTRYLWSGYEEYFRNGCFRFLSKPVVNYLRNWDKVAAQRPDEYVAISKNVQARIKKYYGRESVVIYPPVVLTEVARRNFDSASDSLAKERTLLNEGHRRSQCEASQNLSGSPRANVASRSYFLIVSRLVPYKRVDIVVKAFNQLGLPLKIIGTGSEMVSLKNLAKFNIEFLGQLTDKDLLSYYQNCRALIFPQEEDFGLVPLEAQACGKPVIAFKGGGALETVIETKTGTFFYPQTPKALIKKLKEFKINDYRPEDCRKNAEKFNKELFKKKFKQLVYDRF
jgi:glycosyltransferase involved in cell wall biosynthesis